MSEPLDNHNQPSPADPVVPHIIIAFDPAGKPALTCHDGIDGVHLAVAAKYLDVMAEMMIARVLAPFVQGAGDGSRILPARGPLGGIRR
jgi:hypothetical protein